FNTSGIPANVTVNSVTGWIGIISYSYWGREWQFFSSMDPISNSGTTLYNSATTPYSTTLTVNSPGGWISNEFNSDGINYINTTYNNNVSIAVRPINHYSNPDYYQIANHTSANPPYLSINYTVPSGPPSCATLIH